MFGLENLLDEKHMYISSSDNGHISFLGFQLRIYMPILHNLSVKKNLRPNFRILSNCATGTGDANARGFLSTASLYQFH